MGSATKLGITNINSIEKTREAEIYSLARVKIGETTKSEKRTPPQ